MTRQVAYRLVPRSPFHFGERGVGLEETSVFLHSDTLFSAICMALREINVHELDRFLAAFPRYQSGKLLGDKDIFPLRISSAFPFSGKVYLFPRPLLRLQGISSNIPTIGKTLKRIIFLSKSLYEDVLAGLPLESKVMKNGELRADLFLQSGRVWVTAEENIVIEPHDEVLWSTNVQPKVTVDRIRTLSQVYSVGQVRFSEGCGLYFIIEYQDESWQPLMEKALRMLGDQGIGGGRSGGLGQFTLEKDEEFSFTPVAGPDTFTSLSLYWPDETEVGDGVLTNAHYSLINRRGWIGSPDGAGLRRNNVRMLGEGSVFKKQPMGALVDVTPVGKEGNPMLPHPVWRNGLSFSLPCRMEESNDR